MQLYAITDRTMLPSGADTRELAALARNWAQAGVAYIQVREKDLSADALALLSEAVVAAVQGTAAKVLVNGTPRVAAAAGAAGVHLPAGWTAEALGAARNVFQQRGAAAVISVACHSNAEAVRARDLGADLALLSPVFEKRLRQRPANADPVPDKDLQPSTRLGMGLTVFREACALAAPLPIFALGGVTAANARQCVDAGAAGIAAIRLFMGKSENWRTLLAREAVA